MIFFFDPQNMILYLKTQPVTGNGTPIESSFKWYSWREKEIIWEETLMVLFIYKPSEHKSIDLKIMYRPNLCWTCAGKMHLESVEPQGF
jgi:hypothetical protein